MTSRIQQIILVLIVLAILSQAKYCLATDQVSEETLKKYKEEAQELAKNFSSSTISSIFENDLDSSKSSEIKNNMAFYQGENVANAGIDIERASDQGAVKRKTGKDASKSQCNANNCELGNIFSSSAMEDRQVRMEEAGFIKDAEDNIIDNHGYLDKAKKISRSAASNFDFLKGEYKNCKAEDSYTTSKTVESCDQYYDVVHNNCPVNQVVEIDPRYLYQCHKKREVKEKVCNEYVNTRCDQVMDCGFNAGGIVEGSVDTGIDWNYSYPYLRLGTKTGSWHFKCEGDDFFGAFVCCKKVEMTARFKIKDIKAVKNFALHKISYDDHAMVYINGNMVHNTLGGYKLDITNSRGRHRPGQGDLMIDAGNGRRHECYRIYPEGGINNADYVGKDLKPYLKEGWNDIKMTLVYAQYGQFNVEFNAEQYCCNSWNDKSEVKCDYVN